MDSVKIWDIEQRKGIGKSVQRDKAHLLSLSQLSIIIAPKIEMEVATNPLIQNIKKAIIVSNNRKNDCCNYKLSLQTFVFSSLDIFL